MAASSPSGYPKGMRSPVHTNSLTWADLLALSNTTEELLGVVRDFLASWSPQEINALPPSCRPPGKFTLAEDVVLYTFALVDQQMHSRIDDPGVYRMVNFFSEATRRVTQLMGQVEEEAEAANAPLLKH